MSRTARDAQENQDKGIKHTAGATINKTISYADLDFLETPLSGVTNPHQEPEDDLDCEETAPATIASA